jgi:hypothetical protein
MVGNISESTKNTWCYDNANGNIIIYYEYHKNCGGGLMNYTDFVSIITILSNIIGSVFDALDSIKLMTIGIIDFSLLDVLVCSMYLLCLVGFFNWMRKLGGGSEVEEEYGPVRPKVRNTRTGKVYRK